MGRLKDPDRKFKVLSGLEYKRIRETVELAEWYAFEPTTCGSMNEYGRTLYTVKMVVFRKANYYVWNVMGMVGSVSTLAFFACLFRVDDWEGRGMFISTLLLTTIAFKFVVADCMPKVSFFTLMDLYLMSSFLVLVILLCECAGICWILEREFLDYLQAERADLGTFGALMLVWILGHFWFFARFYRIQSEQEACCGLKLDQVITNHEGNSAVDRLLGRHGDAPH